MDVVTTDPHLEKVVEYSPAAKQEAAVELMPPLGGFITALVLMPDRWLAMTAFFLGGCCLVGVLPSIRAWRRLRRRLATAPPVPADAVEVERRESRLADGLAVLGNLSLLLGAGWVFSALEDSSFAWGLLVAAALLGASAVREGLESWTISRWEHRHGRILRSLLLRDVFYVDRPHAA